jgi:hypothetical protein
MSAQFATGLAKSNVLQAAPDEAAPPRLCRAGEKFDPAKKGGRYKPEFIWCGSLVRAGDGQAASAAQPPALVPAGALNQRPSPRIQATASTNPIPDT